MSRAPAILVIVIALGTASASHGKDMRSERPGRAFFERGEANFNRGKFDEARADYQAAYEAEPLPAFLFNIAQCYRNLGDFERAQFFYQRYTMLDSLGTQVLPVLVALPDVDVEPGTRPTFTD